MIINKTCVNLYMKWETNGVTVSRYVQNINREKSSEVIISSTVGFKGLEKMRRGKEIKIKI